MEQQPQDNVQVEMSDVSTWLGDERLQIRLLEKQLKHAVAQSAQKDQQIAPLPAEIKKLQEALLEKTA